MNETNPGSSYKSSRITPVSGSAVIIPPQGLASGPETVINPEARPEQLPEEVFGSEHGPVSELATVLFSGTPSGSGSHIPDPQGIVLGHFRIESCIRNGGMGAVFKAIDLRLNRQVALKVLPPANSNDPSIVQRFRHEAQAVAQLDHENIARVHFIGEDQGLHYIAFEFVDGTNLRDLIHERGTIHPDDAVNYTLQMAHALVHMQQHHVVHRDIKPSNIIVTPVGRAKLVDLGLARLEDRDPAEQLTVAGTTLGTFDYISPEQAKDPRTVDVRSDIYSLGCSLYHMLTGEAPYAQGTMLQKLLDHQAKDVPDPRHKNRFLSADLSAIVQKMMSPDPQGRYQTPEHLIRDLVFVAESMGLQKVATDGRIWIASQPQRVTFLQKHGGWLISAAVLMIFVSYLKYSDDRNPRYQLTPPPKPALKTPEVSESVSSREKGILPGPLQPDSTLPQPEPSVPPAEKVVRDDPAKGTPEPDKSTDPGNSVANKTVEGADVEDGAKSEGLIPLTSPKTVFSQPTEPSKLLEGMKSVKPPAGLENGEKSASSTTPQGTNPKPGESTSPTTAADLGKSLPFSLLGSGATPERSYPTLEAACADAVDGSIIELRFEGVQRQRPIRISKKITIRAAKGSKPQLEIAPQAGTSDDGRLITINGGNLLLVDVDLNVSTSDLLSSDVWTLFSVQKGEQLRLENCQVTLLRESGKAPQLFEFRPAPSDNLMGMDTANAQANRTPFRVEVENSMIRGEGDVFLVRHAQGLRLSVNNCIVAVTGVLLRSEGEPSSMRQSSPIEMRLVENTLVLNGGLISYEAGELPRTLSRIDVQATNNIITAVKQPEIQLKPLISMAGKIPQDDFNRLLEWSGLKNFYYPFETFWSTESTDVAVTTKNSTLLKFADWTRRWGPEHEVDAHDGLIIWLQRWTDKTLSEVVPSDFRLDPNVGQLNPAIAGANDGGDAGVDLEKFPRRLYAPIVEEVETLDDE